MFLTFILLHRGFTNLIGPNSVCGYKGIREGKRLREEMASLLVYGHCDLEKRGTADAGILRKMLA